jgi:hypothetical protein
MRVGRPSNARGASPWRGPKRESLHTLAGQTLLEQNQSLCTLPHVRKNKDEIQGSFPFAALEGQDDDFKK